MVNKDEQILKSLYYYC